MPFTYDELKFYGNPEVWPEFMRSALLPTPPGGPPDWPDAQAAASGAPVNPLIAGGIGGPMGELLFKTPRPPSPTMQQPARSFIDAVAAHGEPLFQSSGMYPTPPSIARSRASFDALGQRAPASLDDPFAVAAYRQRNAVRPMFGRSASKDARERADGAPPPAADPTQVDVADDVLKSGGIGVLKGGIGTLGMGGDVREGVRSAVDWLAAKFSNPTLNDLITGNETRGTTAGDIAARMLPKVPNVGPLSSGAPSWGASAAPETEDAPVLGDAAAAQDAYRAAAMRTGQWRRRGKQEYEGYAAPPPTAPPLDDTNPDLSERRRLNLLDSYYRGTLFGAGRLALLAHLDKLPDDGVSPATQRVRDELRKEYRQIVADLDRYDSMPRFQNASEFGAAALGRLGGGVLSPEGFASLGTLSPGVQGGKALWNAGKAALKNSILFGGTDPLVQGLNINAGVQDEYSPLRTFVTAGLGALFGGGAQLGAEALGKAAARWLPELGFAIGEPVKVRVYRVEGAPNTRILISDTGDVIVRGRETLFLNFGSRARAEELLARRIAQGMQDPAIKSFDVPQGFLHGLREAAIAEGRSKKYPNRPLLVDETRAPDQFGLRGEWIDRLIDDIIAGSGTVER